MHHFIETRWYSPYFSSPVYVDVSINSSDVSLVILSDSFYHVFSRSEVYDLFSSANCFVQRDFLV